MTEPDATITPPPETPTDANEKPETDKKDDDVEMENANDDNANDNDDGDDDDNTSSTSLEIEGDNDDDDKDDPPQKDPELLLIKANALKEEGNNYFKEKEYEKASRSYRRGTNTLKPLNKGNTGDEQVKALLVSLQTNLSMMCLKTGKHKQSAQVASAALQIDANNVKALFRRALAYRQMGDYELAKADLKKALQLDANNTAVKKEFVALKKAMETAKQAQKKGLQKAFQGGASLYDDKEQEKKEKEEQAKKEKQRQEELLKKRKAQWEDECVKRMAQGKPAITYEDWDKEEKEKEKAEEKRQKEERRKARAAARQSLSSDNGKDDDDDDDDDELTEQELAQLRGYKKTSDGRVTSYFTREQSDREKALIGDIAPKRLESTSSTADSMASSVTSSGKGNPSAWNQAGTTWEEKDTSEWCRDQLKKRLLETKVEASGSIVGTVCKVDTITGDASVAIASGKKRYIFDFHCGVDFEVRKDDDVVASGTLKLPDICSTHHHELEIEFQKWKKSSSQPDILQCRESLVSQIRESVKQFVTDFNEFY